MSNEKWRPSDAEYKREPAPKAPENNASSAAFAQWLEKMMAYTPDEETAMDTYGLQFDGFLERIHAAEAYFEANPDAEGIRVPVDPPSHGTEDGCEDPTFTLWRFRMDAFKHMAFSRWLDLTELSPLGGELARDIEASWKYVDDNWDRLLANLKERTAPQEHWNAPGEIVLFDGDPDLMMEEGDSK